MRSVLIIASLLFFGGASYAQNVFEAVIIHCKICNETQCLPKVKVPAVNLPAGFSPGEANVVVKGICNNCSV